MFVERNTTLCDNQHCPSATPYKDTKILQKMPGLTVDTSSPSPLSQQLQPQTFPAQLPTAHSSETTDSQALLSSSASPASFDRDAEQDVDQGPPVSPLTPTLAAARLSTAIESHVPPPYSSTSQQHVPRQTYTHSTQSIQMGIAPPAPVPIDFEDNPDTLALKSAIAVLQLQRKTAERDMKILRRIKERAAEEPNDFLDKLAKGEIKTVASDSISDSEGDEDGDVEMFIDGTGSNGTKKQQEWERIPGPQNVVRCPPVKWEKYAVVGESLDKMHQDQLKIMNEGMPQKYVDGQYHFGGEGHRREGYLGNEIGVPYTPGKDLIEKMSTRKGGKR